ncbi:nicotinamide-nucleotide amidohydrolase family protein [Clostridium sp. P21]|uniref:Nicotinamide-nucleotide amidohydrolase family protein n=1 Tax=Clostridium muellerianum TaxID=2716538 RepID=A0A7Y0EMS8_9CLOT|nr:nicotinamide-nucleotide amidohydrolase family protein [Clostridium muellerianum]NMM65290.1 nicotinamide-nucleotide amidohydrolase family protein [Clostridium muellerianum]
MKTEILKSKVLKICGIDKNILIENLKDIMNNSTNPTITICNENCEITLTITAKCSTEDESISFIEAATNKIRRKIGDNIYGEGETSLEAVIGKLLIDKNLTISTAESCTGGLIASKLVNYPGISSVFLEGAVTYSNEAKMNRINVKKETLDKFGAVSKETAYEMAEGIAKTSGTNIGLSTTGIAGPGGGTKEKPVGLVYIGLYINGNVIVKKLLCSGNREMVRTMSTISALDLLRKELIN